VIKIINIETIITADSVIYRAKNKTLKISHEIVQDAKIYGYDLMDKRFIVQFFSS
jgi:hypothetical protein